MPNTKSKDKKNNLEVDQFQSKINILLNILSYDEAKLWKENMFDPIKLRNLVKDYLDQCKLQQKIDKPTSIKSDGMKNNNSKIISNSDRINKNDELEPDICLWDSCVLDYFLNFIYWSTDDWIKQYHGQKLLSNEIHNDNFLSIFNYTTINDSDNMIKYDDEQLLHIIIGFTIPYILIRQLQIWQIYDGVKFQDSDDNEEVNNCLMSSIYFIKSLFQSNSKHENHCVVVSKISNELKEFQDNFKGIFSILDLEATYILIEFISKNFLHKYYLLESVFGPKTAKMQDIISVPCSLKFDTLLQKFEKIPALWPAPLSEAINLKLVSNYSNLFDKKVTRWLEIMKSEDKIEKVIETVPEVIEKIQEFIEIPTPEPELNIFEKYLNYIDSMNSDQLKALSNLTFTEAEEIVNQLIIDLHKKGENISKYDVNQFHDKQIELAHKLIEKSNEKVQQIINQLE